MTRTTLLFLAALMLAGCPPDLNDDDDDDATGEPDDDDATDDDDTAGDDDDSGGGSVLDDCEGIEAEVIAPADGSEGLPALVDVTVQFLWNGDDAMPPDAFTGLTFSSVGGPGTWVAPDGSETSGGLLTNTYRLEPDTQYWFEAGFLCADAGVDVTLVQTTFSTDAF